MLIWKPSAKKWHHNDIIITSLPEPIAKFGPLQNQAFQNTSFQKF